MPHASVVEWVAAVVSFGVLIVAAVTDVKTGKVFNWLTLPAMVVGLTYWTIVGTLDSGLSGAGDCFTSALGATLLGLVGFGLLVVAGGLGFGDVKLMGALGALSASWQCVVSTAVYAFALGLVMAVIVMIQQGLVRRTMHRLLNVLLSKASRTDVHIPDDSPRLPFAVPIAIGGALAVAEVLLGVETPWAANW